MLYKNEIKHFISPLLFVPSPYPFNPPENALNLKTEKHYLFCYISLFKCSAWLVNNITISFQCVLFLCRIERIK